MVRFKNRYVVCELIPFGMHFPIEELTEKQLSNLLRDEMLNNFGDLGLAKVYFSFQVKYWNKSTRLAILRVPRDHLNILMSTLALVTSIQGHLIKFRVLHCSGTIKKAERSTAVMLKNWVNQKIKSLELNTLAEAEKLYGTVAKQLDKVES
jgi:ribonuclease P/MRP protein subunit POP5